MERPLRTRQLKLQPSEGCRIMVVAVYVVEKIREATKGIQVKHAMRSDARLGPFYELLRTPAGLGYADHRNR